MRAARPSASLRHALREAERELALASDSGDPHRMRHSLGAAADTAGRLRTLLRAAALPADPDALDAPLEHLLALMDAMAERLSDRATCEEPSGRRDVPGGSWGLR